VSAVPLILSGSPRAGGNSDNAARAVARAAASASGAEVPALFLRDYSVAPCTGCGACEKTPDRRCILDAGDRAPELFAALMAAPALFLSAPIYFYHLPAPLKAFIDRGQSYWLRRRDKDPERIALPPRPAWVCLAAGRTRGEKLFEGGLLTLKYFLATFNFQIRDPLTLYGLDGPKDLADRPEALAALARIGAEVGTTGRGG